LNWITKFIKPKIASLFKKKTTDSEQVFLKLRYDGLTMEEITEDLGESSYKVRQTLREKISLLEIEYAKIP
jgi:DNA-directed RNA polymerase specialized sigma24 family protein